MDIYIIVDVICVHVTPKAVSNATKCETWEDIQASHSASGRDVVVMLDDTYGIWSLLAIGLSASVVIVLVEALLHWDIVMWNPMALIPKPSDKKSQVPGSEGKRVNQMSRIPRRQRRLLVPSLDPRN